jgi:hypothetical protein
VPRDEQLTIRQTSTGYWSVRRGAVDVSSAPTRKGAEAERELLKRLSAQGTQARRRPRRAAQRERVPLEWW